MGPRPRRPPARPSQSRSPSPPAAPPSPGLARTRAELRLRLRPPARARAPGPGRGARQLPTCGKRRACPYRTGSCSRRRNRTAPSFRPSTLPFCPGSRWRGRGGKGNGGSRGPPRSAATRSLLSVALVSSPRGDGLPRRGVTALSRGGVCFSRKTTALARLPSSRWRRQLQPHLSRGVRSWSLISRR